MHLAEEKFPKNPTLTHRHPKPNRTPHTSSLQHPFASFRSMIASQTGNLPQFH